jgi:transcriptional regulator with XRE-family HTH domain
MDLNLRIANRIAGLRKAQKLSLDALAARSQVSRSMLSLIERGESSPTAVVLEKVAVALGVTLASLFEDTTVVDAQPVQRRVEQPVWRDPQSGYLRRNVSPPESVTPLQLVEVEFPPGARVAYESGVRSQRVHQLIWLLDGAMEIRVGEQDYRLEQGDSLAFELNQPVVFHNPGPIAARYAVVLVSHF